jgi:hypothetical protein
MPISGLVVTLTDDFAQQEAALLAMRKHPALELGERRHNQVPLVVETVGDEEDRLMWEWLSALPGVAMVVVAFVHFDDDRSVEPNLKLAVVHETS